MFETKEKTKQCPVCKAHCFDDMEVCYGCLYQFGKTQSQSMAPKQLGPNKQKQPQLTDLALPIVMADEESMMLKVEEQPKNLDVLTAKEIRAKHRVKEPCELKNQSFQAEYKLVISLVPNEGIEIMNVSRGQSL